METPAGQTAPTSVRQQHRVQAPWGDGQAKEGCQKPSGQEPTGLEGSGSAWPWNSSWGGLAPGRPLHCCTPVAKPKPCRSQGARPQGAGRTRHRTSVFPEAEPLPALLPSPAQPRWPQGPSSLRPLGRKRTLCLLSPSLARNHRQVGTNKLRKARGAVPPALASAVPGRASADRDRPHPGQTTGSGGKRQALQTGLAPLSLAASGLPRKETSHLRFHTPQRTRCHPCSRHRHHPRDVTWKGRPQTDSPNTARWRGQHRHRTP
jgi:hypothetical protein